MKKIFTFLFAIALSIGVSAQCPLTKAVNFTATDIHGTEIHLFDILDGGQYVLIDFFFTTCVPCQQITPKMVESYYAMGCNMHDVFYMEIAFGDSDANCLKWVEKYGVEYPTISGVAGGTAICNQYGLEAFPTVILIAPDRSIVIQDLYPIPSAQTVISELEKHGLQQYECGPTNVDEFSANSFSLYPNPANDFVKISGKDIDNVMIFNIVGQKVEGFTVSNDELKIDVSSYDNGIYFVKVGDKTQRFVVAH